MGPSPRGLKFILALDTLLSGHISPYMFRANEQRFFEKRKFYYNKYLTLFRFAPKDMLRSSFKSMRGLKLSTKHVYLKSHGFSDDFFRQSWSLLDCLVETCKHVKQHAVKSLQKQLSVKIIIISDCSLHTEWTAENELTAEMNLDKFQDTYGNKTIQTGILTQRSGLVDKTNKRK